MSTPDAPGTPTPGTPAPNTAERPRRPRLTPEQVEAARRAKARSEAIVTRFADRIPPEALERIRKYLWVGETAEMTSLLLAVLEKHRTPVSAQDADALREYVGTFTSESLLQRYPELADADQAVARLNLAG